jgi:hypothetical protein
MDEDWNNLRSPLSGVSVWASLPEKRNSWLAVSHSSFHHQILHFRQPPEGEVSSFGEAFEANGVRASRRFVELNL